MCGNRNETVNLIINECKKKQKKTKTGEQEIQKKTWLDGKGDPLEIARNIKFLSYKKVYMHKPESVLENETHVLGLWNKNGSPNSSQTTRPSVN